MMIAALRDTPASRSTAPAGTGSGPSQADIFLYQGDDYFAVVNVSGPDGTPADITGYVPLAQIRRNVADMAPEIAAQFVAVLSDAPNGEISLSLGHAITLTLSGRYIWDLQVTAADGTITTILAGSVQTRQEITR